MPCARRASLLAFLLIGLLLAPVIRQGTYAAAFTDPAAFMTQARGFPSGEHWRPVPVALWATWRYRIESATALAARGDLELGTEVGITPLGNPALIAAFTSIGGELAGYLVAPLSLALLMACAFALARRLAGSRAGVIAAALVGTCPALVYVCLRPMSDVPAAALWALSVVMALGAGAGAAAAAGVSVAMAVMVRPNLMMLAIVPAMLILVPPLPQAWRRPALWRWPAALIFSVAASLGLVMVLWSHDALYLSPFTPGYPGPGTYFSWDNFPINLGMYPRLLVIEHSPAILLGLAAAPWWQRLARPRDPDPDRERGRIVGAAVTLAGLNLAAYLLYLPYDNWGYLRFMAPALFALFTLFGAAVVWIGDRLAEGNPRVVSHLVVAAVTAVPLVAAYAHYSESLMEAPHDRREMAFGRYLSAALPSNALIVTFLHSASAVYYTGRPIVRYDQLDPPEFDAVIASIERHGHTPYLLLEERFDGGSFKERFPTSVYSQLDWPPRAVSDGFLPMSLHAFADRAADAKGERWPVDVVGYIR